MKLLNDFKMKLLNDFKKDLKIPALRSQFTSVALWSAHCVLLSGLWIRSLTRGDPETGWFVAALLSFHLAHEAVQEYRAMASTLSKDGFESTCEVKDNNPQKPKHP